MAITAAMVKELREMTGAGMMDCKKALKECDGDIEKALDYLREKSLAASAKKASRIAAEGIVDCFVCEKCGVGVIIEVNCETDFVAKTDDFKNLVASLAKHVAKKNPASVEDMMAQSFSEDESKTVAEELAAQIAVIGENLKIRRFQQVKEENGFVASYIHAGGKIGVLVDVVTDVVNDEVKEMAKNVAMQVAALKPLYTSRDEISADYIAHEKEILLAQIKNDPKESAKPEKVIEGMINGRVNKELKEICLLDQVYVKAEDGKQSVKAYVDSVAKAAGANITIKGFVRFETGEGLEKKNEDFAAEVAKQMNA